jgi:protein-tyrosine phosphatase
MHGCIKKRDQVETVVEKGKRAMLITELPFGLPGRIFRSPMPFGKFDPEGLVYEAYRDHDISVIVLLAENHECEEKAGRDLKALYMQDGFTLLHLPIPDYGTPNPNDLRVTLDATLRESQSGRNIVIHCSAGIGRTGLFTACLAKKLLNLPGEQAIEWVRRHIEGAVESPAQRQFVARERF